MLGPPSSHAAGRRQASLGAPVPRMPTLGATEITKHEVVKTLLRSLDSLFDSLALMVQERADHKTLDPSHIPERLNTHEFQLSEKRDIYGPNYGELVP